MTTIGATLLWCVIQVTAVAAAAVGAYVLAFRGGATTRAGVALAGLLTAAALAPLAFSPWPHWEGRNAPAESGTASVAIASGPAPGVTPVPTPGTTRPAPGETVNPLSAGWAAFVKALGEPKPLPGDETKEAPRPVRWPLMVAALFAAAAAMGLLRLGLGAWAVRRSIRRAKPVYDPALFGLVDVLRAELSCPATVELRESAEVATAATAGWRKPVLLLPPDWRGWTEAERRAVVAHELAHVKRRDYLAAVAAQAALAVHFYHPLLHWLAGRVHLEQELAADALAASVSGGRAAYLRTLAELALRRSDGRVAWPARAFLPSRRTFLRRIEMLRDPRRAADRPAPLLRAFAAGGLLLFGLVVAGVRPDPAAAQSPPVGESPAARIAGTPEGGVIASGEQATLSPMAYIPATARIAVIANPRTLLDDPAIAPFTGDMEKSLAESKARDPVWSALDAAGVQPKLVESLAVGLIHQSNERGPEPRAFAVRLTKPVDRSALEKSPTSATVGGVVYRLAEDTLVTVPDERTLLIAKDDTTLMAMLLSGTANRDNSPWVRVAGKLGSPTAAVMVDTQFLADEARKAMGQQGAPPQVMMMFAPVMPLLNDTTYAGIGLTFEKEAGIRGYAECKDESAAKRVAETTRALVTLGRNTLRQLKGRPAGATGQDQAVAQMFLPMAEQLLTSADVQSDETSVTLSSKANGGTAVALGFILPAVQQAREAARRQQSTNNLKQIALAFHNYHDVHGHLPPAVIEENGVARSWRVEILPFIEQNALYEQYRKDQPWDSPDNKRVLEQMPALFRDPSDPSGPNSTSYFALTGPGTPLSGRGMTFIDMIDGTSNTLLVVEAKRDVPWTKPQDVPFDPARSAEVLKSLGGNHDGGFVAAFADGSVRFISQAVDPTVFKGLATATGKEVIGSIDPAQPPGQPTPPPTRP